jgi:hypothetical protein
MYGCHELSGKKTHPPSFSIFWHAQKFEERRPSAQKCECARFVMKKVLSQADSGKDFHHRMK